MATEDGPQFCPWCGTPTMYEPHERAPRYDLLAAQAREHGAVPPPLPARVADLLAGESFVCACSGCRTIIHVVGHRASSV